MSTGAYGVAISDFLVVGISLVKGGPPVENLWIEKQDLFETTFCVKQEVHFNLRC